MLSQWITDASDSLVLLFGVTERFYNRDCKWHLILPVVISCSRRSRRRQLALSTHPHQSLSSCICLILIIIDFDPDLIVVIIGTREGEQGKQDPDRGLCHRIRGNSKSFEHDDDYDRGLRPLLL